MVSFVSVFFLFFLVFSNRKLNNLALKMNICGGRRLMPVEKFVITQAIRIVELLLEMSLRLRVYAMLLSSSFFRNLYGFFVNTICWFKDGFCVLCVCVFTRIISHFF